MNMKLIPLWAGNFKVDGGALFGVIPKTLWSKQIPCDSDNFVEMTNRCLLVDQGERKILIETGTGDHYPERFRNIQGLTGGQPLLDSLAEAGYSPGDITDVLFTHLHWDHVNGALQKREGVLSLTFPNALHWCSRRQWDHSFVSNVREKVTFFTDYFRYMEETGQLRLVESPGELFPGISIRLFDGHTPGQLIPFIRYNGKTLVYTADLIPTSAHIPLLWISAYDLYPVTTMEEKEAFLSEAAEHEYVLFFEHDLYTECATLSTNGKRVIPGEKLSLGSL
jgi:glyoxylase-like metal-dependent hydrolase (beta-lactamase superfamily II)